MFSVDQKNARKRQEAAISPDGGLLSVDGADFSCLLRPDDIREIRVCRMSDAFAHGDEEFHILVLEGRALMLGSFLKGALGAIKTLSETNSAIPVSEYHAGKVPYFAREPGFLGNKLFPIPGTILFPIEKLEDFNWSENLG